MSIKDSTNSNNESYTSVNDNDLSKGETYFRLDSRCKWKETTYDGKSNNPNKIRIMYDTDDFSGLSYKLPNDVQLYKKGHGIVDSKDVGAVDVQDVDTVATGGKHKSRRVRKSKSNKSRKGKSRKTIRIRR